MKTGQTFTPMPLAGGTRERWDQLEIEEVMSEFFEYIGGRYGVLREGQPKLVVMFDNGKPRKFLVEARLGVKAFAKLADDVETLAE